MNSESLELWKVDGKKVEVNENKLEGFSTEDDIKNDLGGECMESHLTNILLIKILIKTKSRRRQFTSSYKLSVSQFFTSRICSNKISSLSNFFFFALKHPSKALHKCKNWQKFTISAALDVVIKDIGSDIDFVLLGIDVELSPQFSKSDIGGQVRALEFFYERLISEIKLETHEVDYEYVFKLVKNTIQKNIRLTSL
ncbi:hypothetical protein C1646_671478 [Rhizophagus diaphanus]|nr:hypothetical protein C1646_671478 [Rhizophagus diaphanus] [Rhizophagus sp. MUCL 43196]